MMNNEYMIRKYDEIMKNYPNIISLHPNISIILFNISKYGLNGQYNYVTKWS